MILPWLMYLLVVPAVLGLAVAAGEPWLRGRSIPTRFFWVGAIAAPLVLACLPALPPRVPEVLAETIAYLPPVVVEAGVAYVRVAAPMQQSLEGAVPVLLAFLLVSALLGVARLIVTWRRLQAERRTWRADWIDGWEVLVSSDSGPAVVGMVGAKIVIPEWIASGDPELRRIVLQHEGEHAAAHDVATLLAGRVLQALVPWNIVARWISTRLVIAIEHDCDLRVLRSGLRRREYERALLAVADRIATPALSPSLSESASHLERRITAMRTLDRRHSLLRPVASGVLATVALYSAFVLPGVRPASAQSLAPARLLEELPAIPAVARVEHFTVAPVASHRSGMLPSGPAAAPAAPDTVYFEHQVDTPVALHSMTPPTYPAEQRVAGTNGELLVQFVVDTLGRMEAGSLRVLRSDHQNFTASVNHVLETARFKPALKGGRKVRQLVQMPFVFKVSDVSGD